MSKTYVAHKFKLNPSKEQISVLQSWCHINRFIWNHFLTSNIWKYKETKKFVFYHEMATTLPILKKDIEDDRKKYKKHSNYNYETALNNIKNNILNKNNFFEFMPNEFI